MIQKPTIIFLSVKTNQQKIDGLCHTIHKHFNQKERLLVIAPNEHAEQYVNDLLWKYPADSFLPHAITKEACEETIAITTIMQNLNQAKILINLCPQPNPIVELFQWVYELYDETHPTKLAQSQQRYDWYRQKGFSFKTPS